jgi:predicted dehydrogenase
VRKGKIRVAVIGVGVHGQRHAEKYFRSEAAELVAVVDTDTTTTQAVAAEYGVCGLNNYANVLADVDAVSIAVPAAAHYSIARDCLIAGLDVLVEKPITLELAQADQLIALAAQRRRILQVGHIERYNPAVRALVPQIRDPRYLNFMRLTRYNVRGAEIDVGLDLMIHDIDLACWLVNRPITKIEATASPVFSRTVDMLQARLHFDGGCIADLFASRVSAKPERGLRLLQDNGCATVDLLSAAVAFVHASSCATPSPDESIPTRFTGDALEAEIAQFLYAIRTRTPPAVDGTAGRRALATALAIKQVAITAPPSAVAAGFTARSRF